LFWYTIAAGVLIVFSFPYFRCFFKRCLLAKRIGTLCKSKGYALHKTHLLWFLGSKHTKTCDFYIESASEIFAVKLFGMPKRLCTLILSEDGHYRIRRFIGFLSYGSAVRIPIEGKAKKMPSYDFRYRYHDEWEIKTPRRILLVHPVSMEIRRQPLRGNETIVGAGDIVNGMEIDLGVLENGLEIAVNAEGVAEGVITVTVVDGVLHIEYDLETVMVDYNTWIEGAGGISVSLSIS